MELPEQHLEERLSWAHVLAVAARAGAEVFESRTDYGIDGTLRAVEKSALGYLPTGYPLDFQLKASKRYRLDGEYVVYDLEVRAYNFLVRQNANSIPCILLLKALPKEIEAWLQTSPQGLWLAGGCYWALLQGKPSNNKRTVRIRIPHGQQFDALALKALLEHTIVGNWQ